MKTKKINDLISQSLNVIELNTLKGGIIIDDMDMF